MEEQNYLLSFDDARTNFNQNKFQSKIPQNHKLVAHLMEMVNEDVIEVRSRSHSPNKSKRRCNSNMSNSISNKDVFISVSSRNEGLDLDKENRNGSNYNL